MTSGCRAPDVFFRVPTMAQVRATEGSSGPTVASLFAGCGGSSLGYRMAGFRVVCAVEWDVVAAAAYRLNASAGTRVLEVDVRDVTAADLGLNLGVDVLDASPPCQDFSMAGRRDLGGERAGLYYEAIRLVGELRPRAFAFETVKGLVLGAARERHFVPILNALRAHGYRVAARVLDASYLGVPQARERVVVVGLREDLGLDPAGAFPVAGPRRTVMRDALPDVVRLVTEPSPGAARNFSFREPEAWHSSRPTPTLLASGVGTQSGSTVWLETRDGRRRPTVADLKALSTFPPDYLLPQDVVVSRAWRLLGNSVPPLMAYSWAERLGDLLAG